MPNPTAASPRANRARVPSVISIACVVLFVAACGEGTSPVAPRSLKPSLSIGTTPQTIEITSTPPAAGSRITSYAVQATATPSGLPVAFATEGPCSVAGNIVSLLERGYCTITATQPGDDTYAAATPVTQVFEIGAESCQGDINAEPDLPTCRECVIFGYWGEFPCTLIELDQTLVFTTTPPASAYVGDTYQVGASSSLGLTPVFSSLTTAVCTVAGTTVTLVGVGTCTVAADQPGEYPDKLPAPQVTQSFALTAWPFTGFLSPIWNTKPNAAKAGSAVPVKFTLGGDRGLAILAAGFPTSVQVACPAGNTPTGSVGATAAKSGLSYNVLTGVYTYVWETKASWKGTCRLLQVKLTDNTTHEATFAF
jgi:hypothetical protein